MRILNLGVLVCVGGVLAALPFRHSKNASQELLHPARATGPTIAADDSSLGQHPHTADLAVRRVEMQEAVPAVPLEDLIAFDAPEPEPRITPRRPLDLPATYDELAVPVIPSPLLQDRFSATVDSRIASPAPPTDSPSQRAIANQRFSNDLETPGDQLLSNSFDPAPSAPTSTNLISAPLPKASQPNQSPVTRERHWIRQP